MEFKDRLKETRVERGLSQKQLGKITGLTQAAIQSLESGRVKTTGKLHDIAKALNEDPAWLLTGRRTSKIYESLSLNLLPLLTIGQVTLWIKEGILPEKIRRIPMFANLIKVSERSFIIEVEGDAMVSNTEPSKSIFPGHYAIIDPDVQALSGDIVLAQLKNGDIKLRQYMRDGLEELLRPFNPEYSSCPITNDVCILGIVLLVQKITKPQQ